MTLRTLTAIIHYQTPDLLDQAVGSFCNVYPSEPLLILDNGSRDGSAELVRGLPDRFRNVSVRLEEQNHYHGPAMDLVLQDADADTVFFLDSDTITHKGGFLEPMAQASLEPGRLGCGQIVYVDHRGFAALSGIPVPVSAFMMVNRAAYLKLPPFIHHGLPVLGTCKVAFDQDLELASYPVEEYVEHLGRGTAERFGYGLGLKSRISYFLHRLGL